MAKKEYKWADIADKFLHDENPYEYITPNGLDAIRNLEGHKKLENATFKGKTTPTHTFGITQQGLDGLDNLRIIFKVRLPKKFIDANVGDLSEEDLRLAAAYNAMLTTKNIERITNSDGFSRQPLDFRSGILTALHTTSMYGNYKKSYDAKEPGSFLRACESGNPYLMLKSLITNSDGSMQQEYQMNKDLGLNKRNLVGILLAANPNMTWNNEEKKFWESAMKNGVFTKNLFNRLDKMSKDYDKSIQETDKMFYGVAGYNVNNPAIETPNPENEILSKNDEETSNMPANGPKTPQNKSFWDSAVEVGQRVLNAIKPMFPKPYTVNDNQVANNEQNVLNNNQEV